MPIKAIYKISPKMFAFFVGALLLVFNVLNAHEVSLSSLSIETQTVLRNSPVGDNTHTDIYDFIALELETAKSYKPNEILELEAQEDMAKQSRAPFLLKPFSAGVMESEFSHILNALCHYDPNCLEIAIYQKQGVLIGLTYSEENYNKLRKIMDHNIVTLPRSASFKPGIRKLGEKNGNTYFQVLYVVYKNKYPHLSFEFSNDSQEEKGDLIGYIQYIKEIKNIKK